MSVRYEWFDVSGTFTLATYREPGTDVNDGEPATDDTGDDRLVERGALVIYGDEAAVLHGTPAELRAFLTRALAMIPEAPELGEDVREATGGAL